MIRKTAALGVEGLTIAATPTPEDRTVDGGHTAVAFEVKHLFTPMKGSFQDFDVKLRDAGENPASNSVEARISVASVDTGNESRDAHLMSGALWTRMPTRP